MCINGSQEAATLGHSVFSGCEKLITLNLPKATNIDHSAFQNCGALTTVNLPAATSFGSQAFRNTGTGNLTVTLGKTPPTLGSELFYDVSDSKSVTVEVPSDAETGYGTVPHEYSGDNTDANWGNAFRGKGWTGTAYGDGSVNSNITLTIQSFEAPAE
jgi:hypothetical protein